MNHFKMETNLVMRVKSIFFSVLLISCGIKNEPHSSTPPNDSIPSKTVENNEPEIVTWDSFMNDTLDLFKKSVIENNEYFELDSIFTVKNRHVEVIDTAFLYTYKNSQCLIYKASYENKVFLETFEINDTLPIGGIKIGISKEELRNTWSNSIDYSNSDTLIIIEDEMLPELGVHILFKNNSLVRIIKEATNFSLKHDRSEILHGLKVK